MKSKKEEVLELINKVCKKGTEQIEFGGEIKKLGQQVVDIAETVKPIIDLTDSSSMNWELINEPFRRIDQNLDYLNSFLPTTVMSTVASGVSTATYAMLNPTFLDHIMRFSLHGREKDIKSAVVTLNDVVDRRADKLQALSLLHEFGLSKSAKGRKSPVDHLETSWASFEDPVTQNSPSITSLIPMRQCINDVIAILLQRRQKQEPTQGRTGKILSIYNQLAKEEIQEWQITEMGNRWEQLQDELSDSKQEYISREEWGARLRKSTVFLVDFLQSLDLTKMKKI